MVADVQLVADGHETVVPRRVGVHRQSVSGQHRAALFDGHLAEGAHRRLAYRLPHLINAFVIGVDGKCQVVQPVVIQHVRTFVYRTFVDFFRAAYRRVARHGKAFDRRVVRLPPLVHLHDKRRAGTVTCRAVLRKQQIFGAVRVDKGFRVDCGKVAVLETFLA